MQSVKVSVAAHKQHRALKSCSRNIDFQSQPPIMPAPCRLAQHPTLPCQIIPRRRKKPRSQRRRARASSSSIVPGLIVAVVAVAVAACRPCICCGPSRCWCRARPMPHGFDIAARVDGRVKEIPVQRGQNVAANAVLVRIDNPETVAKYEQMKAAMARRARRSSPMCSPEHGRKPSPPAKRKWSARRRRWCWRRRPSSASSHLDRPGQRAASPARPGDRCAARKRARRRSGHIGL